MTLPPCLLRLTFLSLFLCLQAATAAPTIESPRYLKVGEYALFLNHSAASDPHHLYEVSNQIARFGELGNYHYEVIDRPADPVLFISKSDAMRYVENDQIVDTNSNAKKVLWMGSPYFLEEAQGSSIVEDIDEELKSNQLTIFFKDTSDDLFSVKAEDQKTSCSNNTKLLFWGLLVCGLEGNRQYNNYLENKEDTERLPIVVEELPKKEQAFSEAESTYSYSGNHEEDEAALDALIEKAKAARKSADEKWRLHKKLSENPSHDLVLKESKNKRSYWRNREEELNLRRDKVAQGGEIAAFFEKNNQAQKVSQLPAMITAINDIQARSVVLVIKNKNRREEVETPREESNLPTQKIAEEKAWNSLVDQFYPNVSKLIMNALLEEEQKGSF